MANVAPMFPVVPADLIDMLNVWKPVGPNQGALRDEYVSFVRASPGSALDRDGGAEHVTASCFVLTPDLDQVLLCFHRKGQFWVQLGGHVEAADVSVASAALREAREEGGINDLRPVGGILDVDRHALGSGFTRCSVHWDVGFGAIASPDLAPSTSPESEDVAWWPVTGLPENVPVDFGHRLRRILDAIGHQSDVG
ncbi:8-oxo-dGTP pyrophosphatase MutT (NUDIX family) [Cryobacterium sp. MP_M5]|uniref:NUDIX hydrolase n=1 Tax=unclassified Cryobacterium TaxID=2649013 RepID=UPI0018CAE2CA|nr:MULTISPECIES: NUDIX domain-containing protein [unclassified Cryobacterium]MBG6059363.1 8-oxo-dGTP pyrophosphatase MutT (NUDIX family) [Cryobacterium sp. MP_M3]MEC5177789.1 8-oxo-dGTP pyrophosphatase MutT (NUDIX family) [Cryobacterium sp. MP_M5]